MASPPTLETEQASGLMVVANADQTRDQIVGDLACKHGLSRERAQMLVERFGTNRTDLERAAQTLRERKS